MSHRRRSIVLKRHYYLCYAMSFFQNCVILNVYLLILNLVFIFAQMSLFLPLYTFVVDIDITVYVLYRVVIEGFVFITLTYFCTSFTS